MTVEVPPNEEISGRDTEGEKESILLSAEEVRIEAA